MIHIAERSEGRRWLNRTESAWIAVKNAAPVVVAHAINPVVGAATQAFKTYDDWRDQMGYISERYKDKPVRRRAMRTLATAGSLSRGALPVLGFVAFGIPGAIVGGLAAGGYEEFKHHQKLKHAGQLGLRENDLDQRLRRAVQGFRIRR